MNIRTYEDINVLPVGSVMLDNYETAWQSRWADYNADRVLWSRVNDRSYWTVKGMEEDQLLDRYTFILIHEGYGTLPE